MRPDLDTSTKREYPFWSTTLPLLFQILATGYFIATRFSFTGFHIGWLDPTLDVTRKGLYTGLLLGSPALGVTINGLLITFLTKNLGIDATLSLGALAGMLFSALYGLSTNFWGTFCCGILAGATSGAITLVKVRLHQRLSPENSQYALGYLGIVWGIAGIVGSYAGGFLSMPAKKFASVAHVDMFQRYPFLLPNLLSSILCFISFLIAVHQWWKWGDPIGKQSSPSSPEIAMVDAQPTLKPSFVTYLRQNETQVKRCILLFALVCVGCIALDTLFPTIVGAPVSAGGFGGTIDTVALNNTIQGVIMTIFAPLLPIFTTRWGIRKSCIVSMLLSVPCTIGQPFCPLIPYPGNYIVINFLNGVARQILYQVATLAAILVINFSSASDYLGDANGLSNMIGYIGNFVGPSAFSLLFAVTSTSHLPYPVNQHASYLLTALICCLCALMCKGLRDEREQPINVE